MTALQLDLQKAPFEWINLLTLTLPVPVNPSSGGSVYEVDYL